MLLSLNNVSFSFGAHDLLSDASWQINSGERIGLIGPNGTGKSTVLRLIMGVYTPNSGEINKANDTTIGFFNQDLLSFSTDDSILKVAMGAFTKANNIQNELDIIQEKINDQPHDEPLLLQYSELLHQFELAGGYDMEHKAAAILEGLGFSTGQLNAPYNTFSGGWRMRVLLSKMMLQQPDILMLDEPTNHLDLPSIEWLERYLQSYPGTVIIVSHDRYFLDKMVTTIVELFMQKLDVYSGNYSFYENEKATRLEFLEREYENQQKFIKQQERFIERFRAKATKAAQAQSAMKRLEKLDKIELPDVDVPKMNINFQVAVQPGKIISEINNLSKSFGDNIIFSDTKLEILRGDKIALVGANGKGKSTLLRIIANTENFEGIKSGGHNVALSFYAQHQLESLQLDNEILEELKQAGTGKNELELRQLLGCFLFSGDDVFKKIKVLSGGEKARVALAKVIAGQSNFLLLDEPTNHLDILSVELLIEALQKYKGTYVLVSHDRYFVSKTANQFWEIQNGKIVVFKGQYSEWENWKNERKALELSEKKDAEQNIQNNHKEISIKTEHVVKPNKSKAIQKVEKKIEKLETEINTLNNQKVALEIELSNPDIYSKVDIFKDLELKYQTLLNNMSHLQKELDQAIENLISIEES